MEPVVAVEAQASSVGPSRKVTAALAVALAGSLIGVGVASGSRGDTTHRLTAKLTAQQVVPPIKGAASAGRGWFTATLHDSARSHVAWVLRFSHLTSRATKAYIYVGKAGSVGRPAVVVCGPCSPSARGDSYLNWYIVRALEQGGAYIQIGTRKHPAGEIRGQIRAGD